MAQQVLSSLAALCTFSPGNPPGFLGDFGGSVAGNVGFCGFTGPTPPGKNGVPLPNSARLGAGRYRLVMIAPQDFAKTQYIATYHLLTNEHPLRAFQVKTTVETPPPGSAVFGQSVIVQILAQDISVATTPPAAGPLVLTDPTDFFVNLQIFSFQTQATGV